MLNIESAGIKTESIAHRHRPLATCVEVATLLVPPVAGRRTDGPAESCLGDRAPKGIRRCLGTLSDHGGGDDDDGKVVLGKGEERRGGREWFGFKMA